MMSGWELFQILGGLLGALFFFAILFACLKEVKKK